MDWEPDFADRSPMLEPLRELASSFRGRPEWPERHDLQCLLDARATRTAAGLPLRLIEPTAAHVPYEETIHALAEMPYRSQNWHDFFNALAWLVYPKSKAALNAAHCEALGQERLQVRALPGTRSRARDALTLFDESGAVVACDDPELLQDLRAFRWKRLFSERRARVRASMRVFVFGHALFEKALRPYMGLTAHALLLPVDQEFIAGQPARQLERIDALAAARVGTLQVPQALAPLPLLGVPGWWPDNEAASFYDNASYFRPRRMRR